VSGPLLRLRSRYYDALLAVQIRDDWGPWVELLCQAVIEACEAARHLARDLVAIVAHWRVQKGLRTNSTAWRLA